MERASREIGTGVAGARKKSFQGWSQVCEHPRSFRCRIYLCFSILQVSVLLLLRSSCCSDLETCVPSTWIPAWLCSSLWGSALMINRERVGWRQSDLRRRPKSRRVEISSERAAELPLDLFPLKTLADLFKFEEQLQDETYASQV